jgi:hypothetical protein
MEEITLTILEYEKLLNDTEENGPSTVASLNNLSDALRQRSELHCNEADQ